MNILTVEGLSYYKRKHIIYQNISINLSKGDCYVIMGRDNEGKTSLLRGILGLEKAAEGSAIWGEGIETKTLFRNQIGFVPDELLGFEKMTGVQLLDMIISLKKGDYLEKADELLQYFGINPAVPVEYMDENTNKCIYLISVLMQSPPVLILDEPFNFLNEETADRLRSWLKRYCKEGNTVLITSDNYSDVADICTKLSVLKNRKLLRTDINPAVFHQQKFLTVKGGNKIEASQNQWKDCLLRLIYEEDGETGYLFEGTADKLVLLLKTLKSEDFIIEDISIEEQLYSDYEWMEEGGDETVDL